MAGLHETDMAGLHETRLAAVVYMAFVINKRRNEKIKY
jgi:hypothetical protein